eukprot:scaffold92_cov86-Skeletonema_marinoi.AAC.2
MSTAFSSMFSFQEARGTLELVGMDEMESSRMCALSSSQLSRYKLVSPVRYIVLLPPRYLSYQRLLRRKGLSLQRLR